jgi:hypothetical protein
MLIELATSDSKRVQECKKWTTLFTVILFILDISFTINYPKSKDILDYIFPKLTIDERRDLFKMIVFPIGKLIS